MLYAIIMGLVKLFLHLTFTIRGLSYVVSFSSSPNSCTDLLAIFAVSVKSSLAGESSQQSDIHRSHFLMNQFGFKHLVKSVALPDLRESVRSILLDLGPFLRGNFQPQSLLVLGGLGFLLILIQEKLVLLAHFSFFFSEAIS